MARTCGLQPSVCASGSPARDRTEILVRRHPAQGVGSFERRPPLGTSQKALCSKGWSRRRRPQHPQRAAPQPPKPQAACAAGAVGRAEQRRLKGGARSALRHLTRRGCLSGARVSERSEFCGAPSGRAAQGSRPAGPTAPFSAGRARRLRLAPAHRVTPGRPTPPRRQPSCSVGHRRMRWPGAQPAGGRRRGRQRSSRVRLCTSWPRASNSNTNSVARRPRSVNAKWAPGSQDRSDWPSSG